MSGHYICEYCGYDGGEHPESCRNYRASKSDQTTPFKSYRRKVTMVRAFRWMGGSAPGVDAILEKTGFVTTIQGQRVMIRVGEWVAQESDGIHHYPIADDVFRKIYELP